ncbi:hypothetical protein BJ138DRAFT_122654 [Hygrophoropsis aurantiaca]|uniref:Uncharacterized protein n=1 Tax=Hygrophoropsis aurantiaca TaxID=72124 RepID=A0ACB8APU0_9AGAM|nr:hypothetical protein BJ138DRAFT_122654 [Hygrophoropsis aurantiaca]
MPSDAVPPPIYCQESPCEISPSAGVQNPGQPSLQIIILPAADAISFQNGYVGAEGERAAIEGELHLKGAESAQWNKVTITLRTVESAYQQEIELSSTELVLYSHPSSSEILPSSYPFAIPLTSDTPQCIHTPHSSLTHSLTATLHPVNTETPPISKSLVVHTRRYTSHAHTVGTSPETHVLDHPARVEVEVPRVTFRVGEVIPVYVTVPPPRRELVVEDGLRLRNVKAELVRVVKAKRRGTDDMGESSDEEFYSDIEEAAETDMATHDGPSSVALSNTVEKPLHSSVHSPLFMGASYRTVVSRSGASCRFHSSKPVRLRFALHQSSPSTSPSDHPRNLPEGEYNYVDSDAQCISVTQATLLHSVTFRLNVHVSFVDTASRTERLFTVPIPIIIIPPPAPLPEVEGWVDAAYQKKHDRPPAKTVRHEDFEASAPIYQEGEAGPSYSHHGAPPPFEDRDVPPPPFFTSEPSTSSGLPTFLESESDIYVANDPNHHMTPPPLLEPVILGEGVLFGFSSSLQFDGHSDDMQRSRTPPPTLEMATRDTNVTELADLGQPAGTIGALGMVLEDPDVSMRCEPPPPPPPAMDDPSDPPPSIDSEFRSPANHSRAHSSTPPPHTSYTLTTDQRSSPPPAVIISGHSSSHGHAPPPYLVPDGDRDQEHVTRPPPYTDLMPVHH